MTEALVAAALRGTARAGEAIPATVLDLDDLMARLANESVERRILLLAGALSVYRHAGYLPDSAATLPSPAPPDPRPACSGPAAALVSRLLEDPREGLLLVALGRLQRAGLQLPPALLPRALDQADDEVRDALLPVLGERGHWLARQNPAWRWAADRAWTLVNDRLPPAAETIWQEGTLRRRVELVQLQRRIEPAAARERVQVALPAEGYEARANLIGALETGLSPADEPFLESMLDDRSEVVRGAAAALLGRLPHSAYVARMTERAEAMFSWSRWPGRLRARLPDDPDPAWKRDLPDRPGAKAGKAPWRSWIRQIAGVIPVRWWLARFDLSIERLLQSPPKEYGWEMREGWADATLIHGDQEFFPAIWDSLWAGHGHSGAHTDALRAVTDVMRPADLDPRLIRLFEGSPHYVEHHLQVLRSAPRPWGPSVGEAYLALLERAAAAPPQGTHPPLLWEVTLDAATLGLPDDQLTRGIDTLNGILETTALARGTADAVRRLHDAWETRLTMREVLPE